MGNTMKNYILMLGCNRVKAQGFCDKNEYMYKFRFFVLQPWLKVLIF